MPVHRRLRWGEQRAAPLKSDTEGREMSGPLSFLASNTHLATRNPKFGTEIGPEYGEDLFSFFVFT